MLRQSRPGLFLLWTLLVPFSLLTVAAMFFAHRTQPGNIHDLLINLAATFAGSIITVIYVDLILQRRQKRYWGAMRSRAALRISALANGCITTMRTALKVEFRETGLDAATDFKSTRDKMIRIARETIPTRVAGIGKMTNSEWECLHGSLSVYAELADRLLLLFGKDFPPRTAELILDIHSAINAVKGEWEVWPDVLGVPPHELEPRTDGSSVVLHQQVIYKVVENATGKLMSLCAGLLEELDDLPSANF